MCEKNLHDRFQIEIGRRMTDCGGPRSRLREIGTDLLALLKLRERVCCVLAERYRLLVNYARVLHQPRAQIATSRDRAGEMIARIVAFGRATIIARAVSR